MKKKNKHDQQREKQLMIQILPYYVSNMAEAILCHGPLVCIDDVAANRSSRMNYEM